MPQNFNSDQNNLFPQNNQNPNANSGYVPMTSPEEPSTGYPEEANRFQYNEQIAEPVQPMPVDAYSQIPIAPNYSPVPEQYPQYPQNPQAYQPQPDFIPNNAQIQHDYPQNYPQNYPPAYPNQAHYPEPHIPNTNFPPRNTPYIPNNIPIQNNAQIPGAKTQKPKLTDILAKKWWIVLLIVLAIASITIGGIAFFLRGNKSNVTNLLYNQVEAVIDGPASLPQGSPGQWTVTITNKEAVAVDDVELSLDFDTDFQFSRTLNQTAENPQGNLYKISRLEGNGKGVSKISFEGILTGQLDIETIMKASVSYTPLPLAGMENNRREGSSKELRTKITSPEVRLTLTPTETSVQNGGEAEFTIKVENTQEKDMNDLRLRMTYPAGNAFNYNTSEFIRDNRSDVQTQPDSGDDIWLISRLAGKSEQVLKLRGKVSGANGVKLTFGSQIAIKSKDNNYQELAKTFKDITITAQPLIITTKIDGKDDTKIFRQGETLSFTIDYTNQSQTILNDVEILGFVEDPAELLDWSTVNFIGGDKGSLNNNRIQWRGNTTPQLVNFRPGDKGQLRYSVKLKTGADFIKTFRDQNTYTLKPRVQAKASNLQQIENAGFLYKAKGNLQFIQSDIEEIKIPGNTQANRKRYRATWTLKTEQNNVNDVTVETFSSLPVNAYQPTSVTPVNLANQINYSQADGQILWKAGKIANYTGIDKQLVTISFEFEVETNGNNRLELFKAPKVTGVDDFTGEKYEITGSASTP